MDELRGCIPLAVPGQGKRRIIFAAYGNNMQFIIAPNGQLVGRNIESIIGYRIIKDIFSRLRTALFIPNGKALESGAVYSWYVTDMSDGGQGELDVIGAVLRMEQQTGKVRVHRTWRAGISGARCEAERYTKRLIVLQDDGEAGIIVPLHRIDHRFNHPLGFECIHDLTKGFGKVSLAADCRESTRVGGHALQFYRINIGGRIG